MFEIGFSELVLVFVIALVVLGPERLPKAARTLGYWMGRARSTVNHLRNELEREAYSQDMRERMEEQMRELGLDEEKIREARDTLLSPEDIARARRRPEHGDPDPEEQDTPSTKPPTPAPGTEPAAEPMTVEKKHHD
jgi:sec-independent protein translocase protein TatB